MFCLQVRNVSSFATSRPEGRAALMREPVHPINLLDESRSFDDEHRSACQQGLGTISKMPHQAAASRSPRNCLLLALAGTSLIVV